MFSLNFEGKYWKCLRLCGLSHNYQIQFGDWFGQEIEFQVTRVDPNFKLHGLNKIENAYGYMVYP
jgi:hypothetical protein